MKKIISIIIITGLLAGLTACTVKGNEDIKVRKGKIEKVMDYDIVELQKNDGIMLSVRNSNWGEVSNQEDYWVNDTYNINYDGTLEYVTNHNLSGSSSVTVHLSDKDYEKIYDFAYGCNADASLEDYKEDGADGEAWTYTFYEPDGEEHRLYSGYSYGNKKMGEIQDLLRELVNEE